MYKLLFLTLLLLSELAFSDNNDNNNQGIDVQHRDVCVVGGGAGGASAAVFLKDRGYSVLLLEKDSTLGGHCDTITFTTPFQTLAKKDIGVTFWIDTDALNSHGLGPWDVSSVNFVKRFAGENALFFLDFSKLPPTPTYDINLKNGTNYGQFVPSPPTLEYLEALGRYINLLNNTYGWLKFNEYGTAAGWYPDRVPDDLLLPFQQWLTLHNFTALVETFQMFAIPAGMVSWNITETIYCVNQLPQSVLLALSTPNTSFVLPYTGCQAIYDGIESFLESQNVKKNVRITSSHRKNGQNVNNAITLEGYNTQTNQPFRYTCDDLVIGFAPTLDNLDNFLNLNGQERSLFENVRTKYYWDGIATVSGPLANNGAFTIRNVNHEILYSNPSSPGIIHLARSLPFGPASLLAFSDSPLSNLDLNQVVIDQLANIPNTLLTATLNFTNFHEYNPYPVNESINHDNGFYTQFKNIQGKRHTYYVGTIATTAGSFLNLETSYDIIKTYFPSKN